MQQKQIFLIDDHPLFTAGLKEILNRLYPTLVIYEFNEASNVLFEIRMKKPDLLVLDISMPSVSGIELSREIRAQMPDLKILVLSMHENVALKKQLISLGIHGFLNKAVALLELCSVINNFLNIDEFTYGLQFGKKQGKLQVSISNREMEVLELISKGLNTEEIAEKLFITKHTVDTHRKNLLAKSENTNTAQLVAWAIRNGLIAGY